MKHFLLGIFMLCSAYCSAQKYALLDKKMNLPVTYANTFTAADDYKGYFPVEKINLKKIITEIEKIAGLLKDSTKNIPEKIDITIGSTTFHGLRVQLSTEDRTDIVLTTSYGTSKSTMHLCDAKISNAGNAFFITTWLKYLHSYVN